MDPQHSQIKKTKDIYTHILTFGVKNLGIHFVTYEEKKDELMERVKKASTKCEHTQRGRINQ